MMCYMLINDGHLSTSYACTDITQSIIIAYFFVLVIRKILTSLRCIEHSSLFFFFSRTNNCSSSACGYHFVSIETKHSIMSKCATRSTFISATHCFCSIFYHLYIIVIGYLYNFIYHARHAIKMHHYECFGCLSRFSNAVFYRFFEQFGTHIPCVWLAIYKDRSCSLVSYWVSRGSKCKALTQHFVVFLHTC